MNSKTFKETNTSSAWYVQIFSFLMSMGLGIKNLLLQIPDFFYPDNPAEGGFFPFLNTSKWFSIFVNLTPLAIVANIANTWKCIKQYYWAENKNLEKTLDLTVKVTTTIAATTFLGFLTLGSTALILTVAPYLLIGAAGLGVIYGIYNIAKRIYRAVKTNDQEKRREHLVAAGKQVISTIVNALALTVTFFLGIKVNAQFAQISGEIFHDLEIIKSVGTILKAAEPFAYALAACVTLGTVPSLAKSALDKNTETWQTVKRLVLEPKKTFQEAGNKLGHKFKNLWGFIQKTYYVGILVAPVIIALEATTLVVNTVFRIAAISLAPLQLLIAGVSRCFAKQPAEATKEITVSDALSTKTTLNKLNSPPSFTVPIAKEEKSKSENSQAEMQQNIQNKISSKIAKLEEYGDKINTKCRAKLALIKNIQVHFQNGTLNEELLNTMVKEAKKISPRVFQSFWREVGEVEEIVLDIKKYIAKYAIESKESHEENISSPAMLKAA